MSRFRSEGAPRVVESKAEASHQYDEDLKNLFRLDEAAKPNHTDTVVVL